MTKEPVSEMHEALYQRIMELELGRWLPLSENMYEFKKYFLIDWIESDTFADYGFTLEFSDDYKMIRKIETL